MLPSVEFHTHSNCQDRVFVVVVCFQNDNRSNYCHRFHRHLLQKIPNLTESIDILVPFHIGQTDGHMDQILSLFLRNL